MLYDDKVSYSWNLAFQDIYGWFCMVVAGVVSFGLLSGLIFHSLN